MKRLKSLRDYLDALAAIGELQEIDKEVDWHLEIGAKDYRTAVLFQVPILKHCRTAYCRTGKLTDLSNKSHVKS